MFAHGPFFFPCPKLEIFYYIYLKKQQKTNRGDASQSCNTFHLKILRAQLVSYDDSITVLLTDEKAEQLQRPDPWLWYRTVGFYVAMSVSHWESACV